MKTWNAILVLFLGVAEAWSPAISVPRANPRTTTTSLRMAIDYNDPVVAEEFANGPQVAMRLLKRSIYNAAELSWDQSLDEIAAKTAVSDHHPDAREGVKAFHEKRTPSFNAWLDQ